MTLPDPVPFPSNKLTFSRQQLAGGRWNIDHPDRVDAKGRQIVLVQEIKDAFPGWGFVYTCLGSQVNVYSEVPCSDPVSLSNLVADHQANAGFATTRLDKAKADALYNASEQMKEFIESRYPAYRQRTLSEIKADARFLGLSLAADYVQQVADWINSCIAAYYEVQLCILAAVSEEEVCSFGANYDSLSEADPLVTISHARTLMVPPA